MKIKIFNQEILNRSAKNFCKKDSWVFKKELNKKICPSYIYKFNNIKIFSDGSIGTFNLTIIKDYLKINSISKFKLLKFLCLLIFYFVNYLKFELFSYKNIEIIENAYIIYDRHSKNYFHWVCDVLPKLSLNKNLLNKKFPVILPSFSTTFQAESLNLLGIKKIELHNKKTFLVKKAIYIAELYPSGNPRPKIFKTFKKNVLSKVIFNPNKKRKIYISRKLSNRRTLFNEGLFEKKLKLIGFEIHNFENYKFSKQVKISAESKIIIGLSGSGLINFIWMPQGSKVIDIRTKDRSVNAFFAMSDLLKIKYFYYWSKFENFFGNVTHSNYKIVFSHFFEKFIKQQVKLNKH